MNRGIGHGWDIFSISFKQSISIFEKKKREQAVTKERLNGGFFVGFDVLYFYFCFLLIVSEAGNPPTHEEQVHDVLVQHGYA